MSKELEEFKKFKKIKKVRLIVAQNSRKPFKFFLRHGKEVLEFSEKKDLNSYVKGREKIFPIVYMEKAP